MTAPDWTLSALCAQTDPALWFPATGAGYGEARRICGRCPVRDECLADALQREGVAFREYRGGMWGGLSPGQRADRAREEVTAMSNWLP